MPTDYRKYRRWFTLFVFVLIGGYLIGMAAYGEPFFFWQYPYSGLGATETINGYSNRISMTVFIADMISVGIIYFCIGIIFIRDRQIPFRVYRILFSFTASFGAIVAALPHNLFDIQHKFGSGFLAGSVWILSILFITDAAAVSTRRRTVMLHAILHIPIFGYALGFAFGSDLAHLFQKFTVTGIAIVLLLSLARLCRGIPEVPAAAQLDSSKFVRR
ncbi:MAG: hypothetical protein HN368_03405 [Spirochaetales bacterium]|jgi:hypothetical protein|nr:hypothetical protein [Spirochaetales bacterium]